MIAVPTQIERASIISKDTVSTKEDIKAKMQESEAAQHHIKNVLE